MNQRTTENRRIPEILSAFRQNSKLQTEQYVLDFLDIWYEIHTLSAEATLEDALSISKSVLDSRILTFFKKYKNKGNLQLNQSWINSYSSIYLKWAERGGFLFPLTLVLYEIAYHDKGLLFDILTQLRTGLIQGTREELHEIIFPILTNFTMPLDELDIDLLKAHQTLQPLKSFLFKNPENKSFAEVLDVSTRTIIRRLKVIRLLQLVRSLYFLDMGKLGYETQLLVHKNKFPKDFMKYLLLSSDLSIGKFSIVQIPSTQYDVQSALQDKLDILISNNLSRRITSWNLSGMSSGEIWNTPPPFFFSQPNIGISTPSTDVDMSLTPTFDSFRELTRADFKVLDVIVREGCFKSLEGFSKSINVNRLEISNRLKEYSEENLTTKTHQFFNVGLDLSVFFFISADGETEIPWLSHLLTFPKIDVFTQQEENPNTYFGYLKIPSKWIKPFARKIDLIRNEYESDVKIYYKIASAIDHFKWGISLADTYHHR